VKNWSTASARFRARGEEDRATPRSLGRFPAGSGCCLYLLIGFDGVAADLGGRLTATGRVWCPQVSWTPASFGFCCPISKSSHPWKPEKCARRTRHIARTPNLTRCARIETYFAGTRARSTRSPWLLNQWRSLAQLSWDIALFGHARQRALQPPVPGLMVDADRLRHRLPEQLQPLVQ
jgi:hypothetical protein